MAFYANWFAGIPEQYIDCGCVDSFAYLVSIDEPDFSNPQAFFEWTVRIHNAVNRELGKPEISMEQASKIWGMSQKNDYEPNFSAAYSKTGPGWSDE